MSRSGCVILVRSSGPVYVARGDMLAGVTSGTVLVSSARHPRTDQYALHGIHTSMALKPVRIVRTMSG